MIDAFTIIDRQGQSLSLLLLLFRRVGQTPWQQLCCIKPDKYSIFILFLPLIVLQTWPNSQETFNLRRLSSGQKIGNIHWPRCCGNSANLCCSKTWLEDVAGPKPKNWHDLGPTLQPDIIMNIFGVKISAGDWSLSWPGIILWFSFSDTNETFKWVHLNI